MQTIIPISVEEASTEVLAKITEVISGKYNCTMQIDLYQGRRGDYITETDDSANISDEIQEIFQLLGKSGQPHFIISLRSKGAPPKALH